MNVGNGTQQKQELSLVDDDGWTWTGDVDEIIDGLETDGS